MEKVPPGDLKREDGEKMVLGSREKWGEVLRKGECVCMFAYVNEHLTNLGCHTFLS